MIKDRISIYLIFNWDGIGIKKGSWDGSRMHPIEYIFFSFSIKEGIYFSRFWLPASQRLFK
jgi:hypothetical protein